MTINYSNRILNNPILKNSMNPSAAIDELRNIIALRGVPDEHLQWILDRSEYWEFSDGEMLYKTGEPVDKMMFILEGQLSFYMDINGRLVYYLTFGNDELTGGVTGVLPYSRMVKTPGTSFAVGKLRGLAFHKKYFHDLENLNPELIQRLIGYMTERARYFATIQLQHEKVSALGKLSAGIAHELNNPAAAITRISSELADRLISNFKLTRELLGQNINPELIDYIQQIMLQKENNLSSQKKINALARINREDEFNDWFEQNNFTDAQKISETLSDSEFTIKDLENILSSVGSDSFMNIMHWLENLLSSEKIITDLEDASGRISKLVHAIKSHVHMDRSSDLNYTGIHHDLENTLTLLGHKLREKNISVEKSFCNDMPEIEAYVGDLNQVWTNIIDNAIYAMPNGGKLRIETSCDKRKVIVRIIDNGPGIPKEILSRIFDPFFTTKKVGEGTGIGLDIVMRVLKQHNADIKVNSEPGKTSFEICLPVSQKEVMIEER